MLTRLSYVVPQSCKSYATMMGKQTTLFSCINFLKSQSAKEDEQATVSEEHVEQSEGNHGADDVPVVASSSTESTGGE